VCIVCAELYKPTNVCLKAAVLQMLKKKEKILKLTVNTGQVIFSGEIYYY